MELRNDSDADGSGLCPAHYVTRDEVVAAFDRAVAEVERIAGEDVAISLIAGLGAGEPLGDGPFTCQEVNAAWNDAAEWAKEDYNPEEVENSHTIRSDSCGDLIVNLATGFLHNPGCDADDVIAEQWADLEPDWFDGFHPPKGSDPYKAAIVATVKGWVS